MKSVNESQKILLLFADSAVKKGLADAELLRTILQQAADREGVKLEFYISYARSLSYLVTPKINRVYDHYNECDLASYDFVYFRKAGTVMQQMLACASYLRSHNVPFYDSEIGLTTSRNKLSQMFLLHEQGIQVPPTLFCRNRQRLVRLLTKDYKEHFTWPVIAKATGGTRGDANYLVKTQDELVALMASVRRHFLIQSFIPNNGDYRALVIGGKLRGLIKRTGAPGSHLNNTSKNGQAQWLPITELKPRQREMAVAAAAVCHRDIAGVDVLISSEDGQTYILEVNRAPQIENATFPDEKASLLVRGIAETVATFIPYSRTAEAQGRIGGKELVAIEEFPRLGRIRAKIDTGAYSNSLHCDFIREIVTPEGRKVLEFSPHNDRQEIMRTEQYYSKRIVSSNGFSEDRFIVELHVIWNNQNLLGQFSLTNRSNMLHSMLIGRKFLRQYQLLVDVGRRFRV